MNNSNGFKMTEIGQLPEDWETQKLESIFRLTSGKTRPKDLNPFSVNEYLYPVFGGNGIMGYSKDFLVDFVTIVLGRVGEYCGSVHVTQCKSWISDNALYAKEFIVENLDINYLSLALKVLDLNRLKNKGGQPLISQSIVYSQKIALPSFTEQQKIASVLSTIQEAKEKTENVIRATKELKKSMMKHLFTYGPVPVEDAEKVPLKETEIGMVPEHWEVVNLGAVASQRKETVTPIGDGTKYIGLEHIDSGYSRLKRYGLDNEVKSSKFRFYNDDILFGKLRPYLDKCILSDLEGICSTDIIVLKTSNQIDCKCLVNMMHIKTFTDYATSTMTGVNHPRTSWKALSEYKFSIPPLPEQKQIAQILTSIDKKMAHLGFSWIYTIYSGLSILNSWTKKFFIQRYWESSRPGL
ncbi:MAG: restriction endonuclease subunit S [Thermodesulfovibrionales bacterium]